MYLLVILPFNNKTVLETTIDNALSANIDECIVVLGHYSSEIKEAIFDNYKDKVKFIENNPVDVGLSVSLYNGLSNITSEFSISGSTWSLIRAKVSLLRSRVISLLFLRPWDLATGG